LSKSKGKAVAYTLNRVQNTLKNNRFAHHGAIIALYVVLACILTFPLVMQINTHSIGGDTSDTYEMVRNTWWIGYALQNGQDIFWQTHLAYPDGFFAITFQANLLQYFPPALLGLLLPAVMALNISVLLTLALNGWALYVLLRDLLGDLPTGDDTLKTWVALLGGAFFLTAPTFQGHLFDGHTGLVVMYPVPLFLWALRRFLRAESWRWGLFLGAVFWFWLSPSGHMLQVLYVLLPVTAIYWLDALITRQWVRWQRISAVGIAGGVVLLMYLYPLIISTYEQSETYLETTYVRYSMDLLAIVSPSFQHPLWGELLAYPAQVLGVNLGEGTSYVGIIVGLLMLLGVWRIRASRFWGMIWLLAFVLALGPVLKILDQPVQAQYGDFTTYITLPLAWVQNLPAFNLARTPARFNFTLALVGVIMASYGAHWLLLRWAGMNKRPVAPIVAVLLVVSMADTQIFFPMPTREAVRPDAVVALQDDADIRAVFNIPHAHLLGAKDALYYQTLHEKPLIAGQLTRQTPVSPAKLNLLESTLNPTLLLAEGADVVVLHKARAQQIGQLETLMQRAQTQLGAPFYEDAQIALFRVTGGDALPDIVMTMPDETTTSDSYALDVYADNADWLHIQATLSAEGRNVALTLNGRVMHRWDIATTQTVDISIPIATAGYHRLAWVLEPACPVRFDADVLTCKGLRLVDVNVAWLRQPIANPITYEGAELRASTTPIFEGDVLTVDLWWEMTRTILETDVRFVHILNDVGELVAQNDRNIGTFEAGDEWAESVSIDISALPNGEYSVHLGWYDFNSLVRWQIADASLEGAEERAPILGTFTRP
jgi:hypothetical protein